MSSYLENLENIGKYGRIAVLIVDPYNDFISEKGKSWHLLEPTAKEANLIPNLIKIRKTAHDLGIPLVYVPHHKWTRNDYAGWGNMTTSQDRVNKAKLFEFGTWGADFHPDLQVDYEKGDWVSTNHWNSSGFANTDLDYQLKRHGIKTVICVGLVANTCLDSTGRYAVELGYKTVMVTDATAAFSKEGMVAAAKVSYPAFAHHVVTTEQLVKALQTHVQPQTAEKL